MPKLRVDYFQIVNDNGQQLEEVLAAQSAKGIDERQAICGLQTVRLEHIEKFADVDGRPLWRLRFSRLRDDQWPSVGSAGEQAKDLPLTDDQFLSEETAAIVSTAEGRLVIQYNHFGVRAPKVRDYLEQAASIPTRISLLPVLDAEAFQRFKKKTIITHVDAVVDNLTEADVAAFEGTSVKEALKASIEAKATVCRFGFSVDARVKGNKIDSNFVMGLINRVAGRAGENDKLVVGAKAEDDDVVERFDLIESRKHSTFDAASIDRTAGRRFHPDQLFNVILQAYRDWK